MAHRRPARTSPNAAAVRAAPDDDTPRMVYADWLDDHGHAGRAAFVRSQVAAARRPDPAGDAACVRDGRRGARLADILGRADWPAGGRTLFAHNAAWVGAVCHRGFAEAVTCHAATWVRSAARVMAAHPVRWVHVYSPSCVGYVYAQRQGTRQTPRGTTRGRVAGLEADGLTVRFDPDEFDAALEAEVPAPAAPEDWDWGVRNLTYRLFFEAAFPGVTFHVGWGRPARR